MKFTLTKVGLIILVLVTNFIFYRSSLATAFNSFRGKNLVSEVKMGKLWGNFDKLRTDAIEFSGWSEQDNIDLSLEPQTKGIAVYKLTKPANARVAVLQLGLAKPATGGNWISISTDQLNWQTVRENQYLHLVPLELTSLIDGHEQFWVKIEANNDAVSGPLANVLYDFYLMFYDHQFIFPNLLLILTTIFVPLLVIIRPGRDKMIQAILLFSVLASGLYLSWHKLFLNRYHSFDSDVICLTQEVPRFLSLNLKSALLGNYCGNKESLNPLIIIASWKIFGTGSEMAIRFSSWIFHVLTIILVFLYGKKIRSFTTGLIAALFIGLHPYLIELSTRGLRDSVFTFIITLFVYLLWETNLKKLAKKIAIFLTSIASIYLRLHSLVQLIGLTLVFVIAKRNIKHGFSLILMLLLIAWPLIATNLKTYQTWNYSEEMHLKWNANVEFAGQPGFPSKESMTLNPFQGQSISAFTYFFKLHSLPDLVISTVSGTIKTFQSLYFKDNPIGYLLFFLGAWLLFFNRRLRYVLLMVFVLELPHFFLAAKNLVEFRSMTQSLPFIGLTIGYIIDRIWKKLKHF